MDSPPTNIQYNDSIKIAILGNSGVGKTCIINRFSNNKYKEDHDSTLAANYQQKFIIKGEKTLKLDLWDTAGQEKYYSLSKFFYKSAYIVIFVYDITVKESFEAIKNIWYSDVKKFGEKYQVLAVVGNKSDLYEKEEVDEEMARAYAEEINATFMLVSAKTGNNINYLFDTVVNNYLGEEFQPKAQEMIEKDLETKSGNKKIRKGDRRAKKSKKGWRC